MEFRHRDVFFAGIFSGGFMPLFKLVKMLKLEMQKTGVLSFDSRLCMNPLVLVRLFLLFSGIAVCASCGNDDTTAESPCDRVKPEIDVVQDGSFLTVEVTRGAPPFEYLWSNGSEMSALEDVQTGEYSVTVIDDNGCSAEAAGLFEHPCDGNTLALRVVADQGSAEVIFSGGVPPYTVLWSTGDTAAAIADLPEGEYEVTVTDSDFCHVSRSTIVGVGCNGTASVTDGNGNVYQTVEIGGQCWMAENLRTANYASGTAITEELNPNSWGIPTFGLTVPNDPDVGLPPLYGNLYNWYAVSDSRSVCPNGWSVPTRAQWEVLIDYAGGIQSAGYLLRAAEGWGANDPSAGDPYEFAALPGGYLDVFSGFEGRSTEVHFWSADDLAQGNMAWSVCHSSEGSAIEFSAISKNKGLAVRCIKD